MDDDEPVPAEPTAAAGEERASLRSGMGFAASSFVANVVVQLFSSVLTSRLYGVRTIGEYALVTAPWLTLIQFSTVSEQIALVRELSVLPARDVRVGRLFFPVLGFSASLTTTVAVIVMALSAAALRGPIDQPGLVAPALVVLAGYVVIENTSWNMDSVFSAFRAGREIFTARLAQALSFLVLSVGLWYVSESVWSLALATVGSFAVASVVRLRRINRYLAIVPWSEVRRGIRELPSLLRFAAKMVPGSIANGLSSQAATWLLGGLTSVATVGAYSRASGVAIRIQDAGFRLSEMVFPALVERHHREDSAGMREDLVLAVRGASVPLFLVAAVGGGVAAGALSVFGEGFDSASDAFALLLLAYSLGVITLMFGNMFLAEGRPLVTTSLAIARAIFIVGTMIPAAVWWGATGASGAFALGYGLDVVTRLLLARRSMARDAVPEVARTLVSVLVAGVVAFAAARFLDTRLDEPFGVVVGGIVGSAVYVPVVLATGGVSLTEVRRMVDRGRERITRRRRRRASP